MGLRVLAGAQLVSGAGARLLSREPPFLPAVPSATQRPPEELGFRAGGLAQQAGPPEEVLGRISLQSLAFCRFSLQQLALGEWSEPPVRGEGASGAPGRGGSNSSPPARPAGGLGAAHSLPLPSPPHSFPQAPVLLGAPSQSWPVTTTPRPTAPWDVRRPQLEDGGGQARDVLVMGLCVLLSGPGSF